MVPLQTHQAIHQTWISTKIAQPGLYRTNPGRKGVTFLVRAERVSPSADATSREAPGRRQLLAMGMAVAPFIVSCSHSLPSCMPSCY
ncbi:hypothetical protein LIER_43928 [Lithospermum erythrorhizon]|uniref:Uncharacterized protein n=1 Tax=Lithospermum erythrorhizon TaxID=34254 RepID=A0AAV3R8H7_LITER